MQDLLTIVHQVFHAAPIRVELAAGGTFTLVYRIIYPNETYYLRMLPYSGESFAAEAAVHAQLCQRHVKVPEVIYFEHCNETLQRSVLITTELKGCPISQSTSLREDELQAIVREAGRDLACINTLPVAGFGWMRGRTETESFSAPFRSLRAFVLSNWKSSINALANNVLSASEMSMLEQVLARYDSWLEREPSHLAHGDFSARHIYQNDGQYTGVIDFTDCQGATSWYDLGYFHMCDGDGGFFPYHLESALLHGYQEVLSLPFNYERYIRLTSILIIVGRILPHNLLHMSDHDRQYFLHVLREDLVALQ
jgi:aminoglycoside phosphotransferase (APT) family kinase protein